MTILPSILKRHDAPLGGSESPLEVASYAERTALIESWIRKLSRRATPVRILEAGCGQKWPLKLDGIRYTLTGLDMDGKALDIRKNVTRDLDEAIHGDLRYADLGERQFDVIYSSYVLEHIQEAETVLQNFSKWLRPGGLLILLIPDPQSVRGFVTRMTPHWFHVLYYRHVLRLPNAGKPGFGPYVTYYAPVVSQNGIKAFCAQHGMRIVARRGSISYPGRGAAAVLSTTAARLVAWLSLGRLKNDHADLLYIIEKE